MASDEEEEDDTSEDDNQHEDLPRGTDQEIIGHYFHKGFTNKQIVLMLQRQHNIRIHERTLKRRLKSYGLKRRLHNDNKRLEHAKEIILRELRLGPDQLNGYRTMWHILRTRYHMHVPRSFVASVLKEYDPPGVAERKRHRLQRRRYLSPGPNFCWHVDGYDKLKSFGFSVHGCIDGFSRRILWLKVQRSNKNPRIIAKYFLQAVRAARGCPTRVTTDMGSENGILAAIQCYLRSEDEVQNAHKYVPSTHNQKIECFWSLFRNQRASWWIDFFKDLHEADLLDLICEIEREAVWFSFVDVLQTDLDKLKDYHNSHLIRKSRHAAVSGIPDLMYFVPEEFGKVDCLKEVSTQRITEMENRLQHENETDDEHIMTRWKGYFQYVLENNGLSNPSSVSEAGALFRRLVELAKGI